MFKQCLLGSIILHIVVIAGISIKLPATPIDPEKIAFFQLVADPGGTGKPTGRDGLKTGIWQGAHFMAVKTDAAGSIRSKLQPAPKTNPAMTGDDSVTETGKPITAIAKEVPAPVNDNGFGQPGPNPAGIPGGTKTGSGFDPEVLDSGGSGIPGNGQSLIPPVRIYAPNPGYPSIAHKNNWEGLVTLRIIIKTNGTVGEITMVKSSGFPALDQEAIRTIKKWRYQPGLRQGVPVEWFLRIPVRFKLEEK